MAESVRSPPAPGCFPPRALGAPPPSPWAAPPAPWVPRAVDRAQPGLAISSRSSVPHRGPAADPRPAESDRASPSISRSPAHASGPHQASGRTRPPSPCSARRVLRRFPEKAPLRSRSSEEPLETWAREREAHPEDERASWRSRKELDPPEAPSASPSRGPEASPQPSLEVHPVRERRSSRSRPT